MRIVYHDTIGEKKAAPEDVALIFSLIRMFCKAIQLARKR